MALDSLDIPELRSRVEEASAKVEVAAKEPSDIPLDGPNHYCLEDEESADQRVDGNPTGLEYYPTLPDDVLLVPMYHAEADQDGDLEKTQQIFKLKDGSEIQLPPGICLSTGNYDQDCKIAMLLKENAEAFALGEFDLGFCDLIPHEIRVSSETPIRLPYRRIPPVKMDEVKTLLNDLMDKDIIRRSSSPYASPVVLVPKKSGALRLCIDYRQLNSVTVKDSFPLPRIEETLQALGGAKFFSSLDLSHGYFQVAMHPESIHRTAFRVPWGLFEFNRMPQGLCNSPSTFQRLMEFIFGDINLTQVVLYLDDILVFSSTFEEHLARLKVVFQRLSSHGLKIKGEKCQLLQKEVRHLGHVVNEKGINVDPDKVERIVNWPTPKTASELISFLGLASYYRRFVPGFAALSGPLHAMTGSSKGKAGKHTSKPPFEWTSEAEESFSKLKGLLSSAPVLAYPEFGGEFVLEVDASLKGLGACLSQADGEGKLHPIAYASRGLRGAEKNYPNFSSFKIELLGLKWAIADKFREYLIGSKCTVLTDNNPLAHLQTANLGATEQRWVAQLAPFDLDIQYRSGKSNRCADALSRCPANTEDKREIANVRSCISTMPASSRDYISSLCAISVLPAEVRKEVIPNSQPDGTTPSIFPSFTHDQLAVMQKEDEALAVVWRCWKLRWKSGDNVESHSPEVKSWLRVYSQFVEHHGVLYREVTSKYGGRARQLLVPQMLRTRLMEMAHDEWGHQGINRTFSILQMRCFWPGLHKDVQCHIKRCFTCTTTKSPTPAIRTPRRHVLATRPLELLAIDFLKLDQGKGGFEDVLVMTDAFTKYSQAVPCRNQTAVVVAKVLRDNWFSHYGAPVRIHSDRGSNFESSLIQELCKLYGVEKTRTTPYHPKERTSRTIQPHLMPDDQVIGTLDSS
ncbi:putative transposon Ty3-I Gag-Pol polyprotein [Apostichopus japonicus]|uniref:Putative transposon Ty3-I Gag-Pol polyprotein n=1 Tax=Stichopus japonicus TaxID=307972 RepID=A0A2G8JLV4_STIJA|nr:putative transposon Ty3-I Gag-Pol polyprotein [Apostichopus japonicus]